MSDKPEQLQTDKRTSPRKADWIFYAVTIGTVLYGVGGFMLFEKFLNPGEYLEFYKWNALGDFLAGVFAPLAFFWLLAAVVTQREELKSSRQQFVDSQTVIQEQLDYIRDQSKKAEVNALREYKLALFEPRIEIYRQLMGQKYEIRMERDSLNEAYNLFDAIHLRCQYLFGADVLKWLGGIKSDIMTLYELLEFRNAHKPDEKGAFKEGLRFQNMLSFEMELIGLQSALDKKLDDEHISKRLMPYLKVYEEDSVSI